MRGSGHMRIRCQGWVSFAVWPPGTKPLDLGFKRLWRADFDAWLSASRVRGAWVDFQALLACLQSAVICASSGFRGHFARRSCSISPARREPWLWPPVAVPGHARVSGFSSVLRMWTWRSHADFRGHFPDPPRRGSGGRGSVMKKKGEGGGVGGGKPGGEGGVRPIRCALRIFPGRADHGGAGHGRSADFFSAIWGIDPSGRPGPLVVKYAR